MLAIIGSSLVVHVGRHVIQHGDVVCLTPPNRLLGFCLVPKNRASYHMAMLTRQLTATRLAILSSLSQNHASA